MSKGASPTWKSAQRQRAVMALQRRQSQVRFNALCDRYGPTWTRFHIGQVQRNRSTFWQSLSIDERHDFAVFLVWLNAARRAP